MPSPYPLPAGCIFREDFRNPALAARNGIVFTGGNPFVQAGANFGVSKKANRSIWIPTKICSFFVGCSLKGYTGLYRTLLWVGTGSTAYVEFGMSNSSNVFYIYSSASGLKTSSAFTPDTKMHTVTLVCDGTNGTLYLDNTVMWTGAFTVTAGNAQSFSIGNNNNPVTGSDCLIDMFAGFNRAISADEIAQLYRRMRGA